MTAREHLDAIKARAEAATPGPWEISRYESSGGRIYVDAPDGRMLIADAYRENNREFLFAARTDIPRMVAALEAAEGLLTEAIADQSGPVGNCTGQELHEIDGAAELARAIREVITDALAGGS